MREISIVIAQITHPHEFPWSFYMGNNIPNQRLKVFVARNSILWRITTPINWQTKRYQAKAIRNLGLRLVPQAGQTPLIYHLDEGNLSCHYPRRLLPRRLDT
jgi:hypothetical protein